MRSRIAVLASALVLCVALPATGAPVFKDQVVFTDPTGDTSFRGQSIPALGEYGLDLVEGSISWGLAQPETVTFEVTVSSMPKANGTPLFGPPGESMRLVWHFAVGKRQYRLTLKSRDHGKPDVFSGSGMERVGGNDFGGHFRLEECRVATTPIGTDAIYCDALEYLEGFISVLEGTIGTHVPTSSIGVKSGSIIRAGSGGLADVGCGVCWIADVAERADDSDMIVDAAEVKRPFRVP